MNAYAKPAAVGATAGDGARREFVRAWNAAASTRRSQTRSPTRCATRCRRGDTESRRRLREGTRRRPQHRLALARTSRDVRATSTRTWLTTGSPSATGCGAAPGRAARATATPPTRSTCTRPATSKRLWRTCATLAEARAWQVDTKQALRKGTLPRPDSPVTLREEAEAWLEGARSGVIRTRGGRRFKPSVLRSYERALKLRILPELGGARLGSITHIDLQHFVDRLRATPVDRDRPGLGPLDPSTIRNTIVPAPVDLPARPADAAASPSTRPLGLELPRCRRAPRPDRLTRRGRRAPRRPDSVAEHHRRRSALGDRALRRSPPRRTAGARVGRRRPRRRVISCRRSWDDKEGVIETKSRAGTRTVPIAGDPPRPPPRAPPPPRPPHHRACLRPLLHAAVLTLQRCASARSAPGATRPAGRSLRSGSTSAATPSPR